MHRLALGLALAALVAAVSACAPDPGTAGGDDLHLPSFDAAIASPLTASQSDLSTADANAQSLPPGSPSPSTFVSARTAYEALSASWTPRYRAALAARPEVSDVSAWRPWTNGIADLLGEFRRSIAMLHVDPVADEERAEFLSSIDAEIRAYREAAEATGAMAARRAALDRLRRETDSKLADFVKALTR